MRPVQSIAVYLLCSVVWVATSQAQSGVSPQVISLPSGPGSIEGLGKSFEPQLNTGTAAYSLDIDVPPGVAGHQPTLQLSFNAGLGNGPFGTGWSLGVPAVRRQVDKGQPSYSSQDRFVDTGGEELVELQDGTWRRENELDGLFARVERLGDGWVFIAKSGMRLEFGQYPNAMNPNRRSRVHRAAGTGFGETFEWCVDAVIDTNGNRIEYYYSDFADSPGVLYLTEIEYALVGPHSHLVALDYDVRLDRADRAVSPGQAGLADYTAGFCRIWGRRCTNIDVYAAGEPVRRYTIDYTADQYDPAPPPAGSVTSEVSRVRRFTQWDSTFSNYLPPVRFSYAAWNPTAATLQILSGVPWDLAHGATAGAELMDVDCDARPDIVDATTAGLWQYVLNDGNGSAGPITFGVNSPPYSLSSPSSRLLDIDGDALPDICHRTGPGPLDFSYSRNVGNGVWEAPQSFVTNPLLLDLNDPSVAQVDIDFDKDIDAIRFDAAGWQVWTQEDDSWTTEALVPFGSPALGGIPATARLDDPQYYLADLNGDRLLDLARITHLSPFVSVEYWPSMGRLGYDSVVEFSDIPAFPAGEHRWDLVDVNTDGIADLVLIESGQLTVWANSGTSTWTSSQVVTSALFSSTTTRVRYADMNADGARDVLFNNPGQLIDRYQYLDLSGGTLAHQLIAIDRGVGNRTLIEYRSVSAYQRDAELAGVPFVTRLPFGMQVVERSSVSTGLDVDSCPGADVQVAEFHYRDPFYDLDEKEFRGFAVVERRDLGEDACGGTPVTTPSLRTRIAYHTGAPDGEDNDGDGLIDERNSTAGGEEEPLRGAILWKETAVLTNTVPGAGFLPDAEVFEREIHSLEVLRIHAASPSGLLPVAPVDPDYEVRFGHLAIRETQLHELASGPMQLLRREYSYDAFGNLIAEVDHGTVGTTHDDERTTATEFSNGLGAHIYDRPTRILVTDEAGSWVKETHNTYDSNGRLQVERQFLDDPATGGIGLDVATLEYNAQGSLTKVTNARGFSRTISYDSMQGIYPVSESSEIGGGSASLTTTVTYDHRFGSVSTSTDSNGHVTEYLYDSFGRLVAEAMPGDSLALPTRIYEYVAGDAINGLRYVYDVAGNLTVSTGVSQPVTVVRTLQRERFGQPGVIESFDFTDGMGRLLSRWIEHDGGYAVVEANLFGVRGDVRKTLAPYLGTGGHLAADPIGSASAPGTDLQYDAMSRSIASTWPVDSQGVRHTDSVAYKPLETEIGDGEDNLVGGQHEGTTRVERRDGLGRTVSVIETNLIGAETGSFETRYEFDLQDNMTRVVDPKGNIRLYSYDGIGRRTASQDPDAGSWSFSYDSGSNVTQTIDGAGRITLYTYDGANRVSTEDYGGDGVDVRYHYDTASSAYPAFGNQAGRLSWVEDPSGAEFRDYDPRGNVTRKVKRIFATAGAQDYHTSASYDAADRPFSLTYPDGETVYYEYGDRGLLDRIPGIVTAIEYGPSGKQASATFANGVTTLRSYDLRTRLTSLQSTSPLEPELQDLTYTLDGVGNILGIVDGRSALGVTSPRQMGQQFSYDDKYRLIQADGDGYGTGGGTVHYQYDSIDNLTARTSADIFDSNVNVGLFSYGGTAGKSGRRGRLVGDEPGPHAVTSAGTLLVDYDDAGNVTQRGLDSYVWDHRDRLVEATTSSGDVVQYAYDYADHRVLKQVVGNPSDEVIYIDGHAELRDGELTKYVFADGQRVARVVGALPQPTGSQQRQQTLRPGWNLVAVDLLPTVATLPAALGDAAADIVSLYNHDGSGYLIHTVGGAGNTLNSLEAGQSYWVLAEATTTLLLEGSPAPATPLALHVGWNQVSLPGQGKAALSSLVGSASEVDAAWIWEDVLGWRGFVAGQPTFLPDGGNAVAKSNLFVHCNAATTLVGPSEASSIVYFHSDHISSANVVTDANGAIVEERYFYPFGLERHTHVGLGGYSSEYRFSDNELDAATGLYSFGRRYYDPVLGRFLSVDPVSLHEPLRGGLGSNALNPYTYCYNRPIVCTDPDGRLLSSVAGAIVGAAIAAIEGGSLQDILMGAALGAIGGALGGGFGLTGSLISAGGQAAISTVGQGAVKGAIKDVFVSAATEGRQQVRGLAQGGSELRDGLQSFVRGVNSETPGFRDFSAGPFSRAALEEKVGQVRSAALRPIRRGARRLNDAARRGLDRATRGRGELALNVLQQTSRFAARAQSVGQSAANLGASRARSQTNALNSIAERAGRNSVRITRQRGPDILRRESRSLFQAIEGRSRDVLRAGRRQLNRL